MSNSAAFAGFSRETVRFFTELRRNNAKPWFDAHREAYERRVLDPARLFVTALGARLQAIVPGIVAVPAVDKSIFRIRRDTRFSLDPAPYKTNLGIYFWDRARGRMESAGFYVGLEPPDIMLGGGMYVIPDSLLGRYRKALVDPRRGAEIAGIVEALRAIPGCAIEGEHYKRVPAGFDPAHRNAGLLRHRGLYAGFETRVPPEFFGPEFVDYCFERFAPMAPLHRWLIKLFD
ncbi:MAG TPA: DUF2461 domain-containing protein [Candidatus Aminicenantes bacterium]|nr:DUF2461 domain-containing protein [Candidatus Aminicenantes bacterium]HRY64517.1 DUF2461 domain-containing protein [Candidatus Aminicenantes bacterium]HRZ71430.1 DUF2461 domain-containing protein [Candidatus Aminicenantes bacterium]